MTHRAQSIAPPNLDEDGRPRVIICGGRTFTGRAFLFLTMDRLVQNLKDPIIVTGGAPGADTLGDQWAMSRGFLRKIFHAEWDKYGLPAGPIRNSEQVKYAAQRKPSFCVAFGGDVGTADMVKKSCSAGLVVREYKEED